MHARGTLLLCVLAAAVARPALGAPVRLSGSIRFQGNAPILSLVATTIEAKVDATPTVVYQHGTWKGDVASIRVASDHSWSFPLPPPAEPGTFPVFIRAEYEVGGRIGMTPLVLVLATPGAMPARARVTLTTTPVSSFGRGELTIENPDDRVVAGRVSFVLPSGLRTDPESVPARVAPAERSVLPLLIEHAGAETSPGEPCFAVFEYDTDGAHHTVVATTSIIVAGRGGVSTPIAIGLAALVVALGVLAFAWRRAAAR